MPRYAVIPAAGLATRFLPASKAVPKEMFPLYDRPVIQHIVEEADDAGIGRMIFVTAEGKEAITDHFDRTNPKFLQANLPDDIRAGLTHLEGLTEVVSVRQKEPKGLGHAIRCGLHAAPPEPFAVMLPDMFLFSRRGPSVMRRMADLFRERGCSVLALMTVPDEDRSRYGMVECAEREGLLWIEKLLEKPGIDGTSSNLAIVGRYLFTPAIAPLIERTAPGAKGEIQLTDAIQALCEQEPVLGLVLTPDDLVFDAGSKEGFAYANAFLAAREMPDFIDRLHDLLNG